MRSRRHRERLGPELAFTIRPVTSWGLLHDMILSLGFVRPRPVFRHIGSRRFDNKRGTALISSLAFGPERAMSSTKRVNVTPSLRASTESGSSNGPASTKFATEGLVGAP